MKINRNGIELEDQQIETLKKAILMSAAGALPKNPFEGYDMEKSDFIVEDPYLEVVREIALHILVSQNKSMLETRAWNPPGFILRGNRGTGKTTILNAIPDAVRIIRSSELSGFRVHSCLMLSNDVAVHGPKILAEVAKAKSEGAYLPMAFDDLGNELEVNYFGNAIPVMKIVLDYRQIIWNTYGIPTYFTTQLNTSELEVKYGKRLTECLFKMSKVYTFKGVSNKREFKNE